MYVVWADKNSTSGDTDAIFKHISISDDGEKFGDTVPLNTGWNTSGKISAVSPPQIAAAEDGNVYVVWADKNSTSGDTDAIFKHISISDDGEKFGEDVPLNTGWNTPGKISAVSLPEIVGSRRWKCVCCMG